jgi:hypothetical protein
MAAAAAGVAAPIAFLNKWSFQAASDQAEVTAFEDANKTYLSGKDDAQGSYSGFWDDATAQTYTAATDGTARRAYFYPDATVPTIYWHGEITVTYDMDVDAANPITISGNWKATTDFIKVG